MAGSLSDLLLQDLSSERADALLIDLGADAAARVDESPELTFVHYALEGSICLSVEGVDEPITLQPGECALAIYGSAHRICVANAKPPVHDCRIREWPAGDEPLTLTIGAGEPKARFISAAVHVVHRPDRNIYVHPLPELVPLKHKAPSASALGTLFTETAHIAAACRGPGASAFVNALMNLMLTHFLRDSFAQLTLGGPVEKLWFTKTRRVGAALRMMKMHPEKNWTVESLARELGYSRSSFADLFRSHAGIGPMEYLAKIRMEMAAGLLRSTPGLSIHLVARRAGYGSAASFSRAFKAHHGVSPRTFCERLEGKGAPRR